MCITYYGDEAKSQVPDSFTGWKRAKLPMEILLGNKDLEELLRCKGQKSWLGSLMGQLSLFLAIMHPYWLSGYVSKSQEVSIIKSWQYVEFWTVWLTFVFPISFSDLACSVAGITSDANVLTNQLRLIAQRYNYSAMHHSVATWESFWLNFDIFLKTFCWLLFEPVNQNMGTVEGEDVKLSNLPFTLLGIL